MSFFFSSLFRMDVLFCTKTFFWPKSTKAAELSSDVCCWGTFLCRIFGFVLFCFVSTETAKEWQEVEARELGVTRSKGPQGGIEPWNLRCCPNQWCLARHLDAWASDSFFIWECQQRFPWRLHIIPITRSLLFVLDSSGAVSHD